MASILNVDQINNAAGTSAVTIDPSTGKPSFPNGATLPAGSVVQVVQELGAAGSPTSNSTSYVDEGIEATITPQFNNSIILVHAMTGDSNSGGYSFYRVRNITDNVSITNAPCGNFSASPQMLLGVTMFGAYVVNSTAPRTFRVEGASNTTSTRYQRYSASVNNGVSSGSGIIILTEIAQ